MTLCIIRHTESVRGVHKNWLHAACMPVFGPRCARPKHFAEVFIGN